MKKTMNYLLSASVLALTFVATAANQTANAQTCVNAPTCAELGYTLTSSTNCFGTVLKCPFDKTKMSCTSKTDVLTAMMPDYKKVRYLTMKTNHYMTENGWIKAGAAIETNHIKTEWYVNDLALGTTFRPGDENSAFYPVAKGDKVYHNGNAEYNYLSFYPCRGN